MSIHRSTVKMTAGVVACTMLLAGCGEVNADRAGGDQDDDTVVLTFSNPFNNDEFPPPGQRVRRPSRGTDRRNRAIRAHREQPRGRH